MLTNIFIIIAIIATAIFFIFLFAFPIVIIFLLLKYLLHTKTGKAIAVSSIVYSAFIIAGIAFLSYRYYHPIIDLPDEYRQYVSDERLEEIVNRESGFYSSKLPVFAERISIKYADENQVIVKTTYLLFGSTVMSYGPDGLSCEQGLFDPEIDLSHYH